MGNAEPMRTSSSRRETRSEHRPNTIGCMSGIFHLLSRHHNRSQKRLTSGKKKEKPTVTILSRPATPSPPSPSPPPPPRQPLVEDDSKKTELRRRSCETPRSPTIPQEIRRPETPPESPRRAPTLVARLMGLEDLPAPPVPVTPPDAAADKRQELLLALERCDEDLKALRRIIEAVRSAETEAKAVSSPVGSPGRIELEDGRDSRKERNGEQPSPVSVLDAISSPRYRSKRSPNPNEKQGMSAVGSRMVKPSRMGVLFTGENYKKAMDAAESYFSYHRKLIEAMPCVFEPKRRAVVENFGPGRMAGGVRRQCRRMRRRSTSGAMVESVNEVWEDGVWEERWEVGRVGQWLEGDILWDLVDGLVVEFLGWCCKLSLPFGTCRKRLYF